MRNSEKDCEGTCELHGDWASRIQFVGDDTLKNECPMCILMLKDDNHQSEIDSALDEGFEKGYKEGKKEGRKEGKKEATKNRTSDVCNTHGKWSVQVKSSNSPGSHSCPGCNTVIRFSSLNLLAEILMKTGFEKRRPITFYGAQI